MKVSRDEIHNLLRRGASRFVPAGEANAFADQAIRTHLRKAPRMNPLKDASADLAIWSTHPGRSIKAAVEHAAVTIFDFDGLAPALKIKLLHDRAEELARSNGIAAVGFRNSSAVITLEPWALGLADRGLIGLAMFNGGTQCAVPHGGRRGIFGTLPISYAIPTGREPLVLDMASTEIPFFEVKNRKAAGLPLPPGAALDRSGKPTTDAAAALGEDGIANLLPLGGGFKGFGLQLLFEVLTGALVGSLMSHQQSPGWNPAEYGGLLIAFDIAAFTDQAKFEAEVSALCDQLRAEPPADGFERVSLPGDRASAAALTASGEIEIEENILRELQELAG